MPFGNSGIYVFSICNDDGFSSRAKAISDLNVISIRSVISLFNRKSLTFALICKGKLKKNVSGNKLNGIMWQMAEKGGAGIGLN